MYQKQIKKVAEKWAEESQFEYSFTGYPPLRSYLRKRITGQSDEWEYTHILKELYGDRLPVPRTLSLFCGHGSNEIRLAQAEVFEYCLGLDISEIAIKNAQKRADEMGFSNLEFKVADLNQDNAWPDEPFDLVIANGGLHHSMELDLTLAKIKSVMKPDALFLSSEYVGPDHYGMTFRQAQLIEAMRRMIPDDLKRSMQKKQSVGRRLVTHMHYRAFSLASYVKPVFIAFNAYKKRNLIRRDPSEGVHSSEVISATRNVFPNLEVRYFGGELLANVFGRPLIEVLALDNPRHMELINLFTRYEELAEENGDVQSHNAFLIARNE